MSTLLSIKFYRTYSLVEQLKRYSEEIPVSKAYVDNVLNKYSELEKFRLNSLKKNELEKHKDSLILLNNCKKFNKELNKKLGVKGLDGSDD